MLTSSVGLMAVFAVDFIDTGFIAMLGNAELAAAVGYAGAILFFTTSFGIGMAIAAGALVARAGTGRRGPGPRPGGGALFGASGVLVGQAVGGVIFAGVAALMVRRMMQGHAAPLVPDQPFDRQARLMSLTHRRP